MQMLEARDINSQMAKYSLYYVYLALIIIVFASAQVGYNYTDGRRTLAHHEGKFLLVI